MSIDIDKAFGKIKQSFTITTLRKPKIEGNVFNLTKNIYQKPTANIILDVERLEWFPLVTGNKARKPTVTTLHQHTTGSSSLHSKARK